MEVIISAMSEQEGMTETPKAANPMERILHFILHCRKEIFGNLTACHPYVKLKAKINSFLPISVAFL